jgi:hypothetical protein
MHKLSMLTLRLEATFAEDPELGRRMAEAILQLVSRGPQHMVGFILSYARTNDDFWGILGALDDWNYVPPAETVTH